MLSFFCVRTYVSVFEFILIYILWGVHRHLSQKMPPGCTIGGLINVIKIYSEFQIGLFGIS